MRTAATAVPQHERDPGDDLLDRKRIAKAPQYGNPSVATQISWERTNRYGWRDMTIRIGIKVFKRRRDLDAWLESRKGRVIA